MDDLEHYMQATGRLNREATELQVQLAASQARVERLEAAIDTIITVKALNVYSDGTIEVASTTLLLDAITDLLNVRPPTAEATP